MIAHGPAGTNPAVEFRPMANIDGALAAQFPLGPVLEFLNDLWRINREMDRLSSRMEVELGVTGEQRLIIRCLGRHPNIIVGELGSRLGIEASVLATALKHLQQRRLIERNRDPRDRRRVLLTLSSHGRFFDRATEGTVEDVLEGLMATADPADVAAAARVLRRLVRLLGKAGTGAPGRPRPEVRQAVHAP